MSNPLGSNARALLQIHSIFSTQKRLLIQKTAREHGLSGICKVGFPVGILAVEGREEHVARCVREIKSLRWSTCSLSDYTTGLGEDDLRMTKPASAPGEELVIVEKMSEVGAYMRRVGLEDWWRKVMGYSTGG